MQNCTMSMPYVSFTAKKKNKERNSTNNFSVICNKKATDEETQ